MMAGWKEENRDYEAFYLRITTDFRESKQKRNWLVHFNTASKYVMYIDIIGTWLFGVPMGLLAAFIFHLPIASVYLLLSLEEVIRLLISIFLFRRKTWMNQL